MTLRGEADVLCFMVILLGRSHRMGHGDRTSYSIGTTGPSRPRVPLGWISHNCRPPNSHHLPKHGVHDAAAGRFGHASFSAIAAKQFARGQRGGILTTSMPASANTVSNEPETVRRDHGRGTGTGLPAR